MLSDDKGQGSQTRFAGLIVDLRKTHKFTIQKCPEKHTGQGRVLINYKRRDDATRFQIVRIMTPRGKVAYAAVVGHYERPEVIMMDHDLRVALNIVRGEETELEIRRCGYFGTLRWYLTVPDPLIRVPAFLAMLGLILGIVGFLIAFLPSA